MAKSKRTALYIIFFLILAALLCVAGVIVTRKVEKSIYKLNYEKQLARCAEEYALDEALIAAVIFTESSWEENAVSPKGAVGLMQIMPDTGEWIAEKMGDKNYKGKKLYKPENNIEYGCWYLRYLLDKYEQNLKYSLVAYNAGPGNLDKWLKDPRYSTDGRLNIIPFEQTENYVEKIYRARAKYQEIYYKDGR